MYVTLPNCMIPTVRTVVSHPIVVTRSGAPSTLRLHGGALHHDIYTFKSHLLLD